MLYINLNNKSLLIHIFNRHIILIITLYLISCIGISRAQEYEWADDFSSYADGSLGDPRWSAGSVDWTMKHGSYLSGGLIDSFSVADGLKICRNIEIEAIVTVLSHSQLDNWRIAGVAIYNNPQNFWHFALVESPSDKDNRHFLELSEKRDNVWLAQENLTVTASEHMDYDWQYNQPYRLRIIMTPAGIEGILSDINGNKLARKVYAFNNIAVTSGRPALHGNEVKICFDDVKVKGSQPVPPQETVLPALSIKTWDGINRPSTGYFHVEKVDNRWWCIAPDGNGFYAIGTDHCNFNGHWCEKLWYAPYGQKNRQKYASADIWAKQTADRLQNWGFNLIAAGHSEQLRYRGLAHTLWLGVGAEFSSISDIVPKIYWTGLPNVFDPRFASFCKMKAKQMLADHVKDPWVFGIFIDNELEWYGKNYSPGGVFDEAMKKDADHSAKIALVDMLQTKYSDIRHLNKSWGTSFADFNAILQINTIKDSADNSELAQDKLEFLELVADRYFAITTAAIREIDPHHMILGCRFAGDAPKPCWIVAGNYCDIVSVNQYPFIDLETCQLPQALSDLKRFSQWTDRPLMLTEWSFPSLDSGLPCTHGAGMRVQTQQQRSQAFEIYQSTLFSLPFIVGSNFFMWVDEPALGISSTFPEDSNYGLVNENDQPYEELTKTASQLNPKVYEMHQKAVIPDLSKNSSVIKYQAGSTWPQNLPAEVFRYPITVSNSTNKEVTNGIISFTLNEVDPDFEWSGVSTDSLCLKNNEDQDVSWQLDCFGNQLDLFDEICFEVSHLRANENRTYFLYVNRASNLPQKQTTVNFQKLDNGFIIDNNTIRIQKNEPDGDLVDACYFQGVLLGRYNPMIHQNQGQNFWAHASKFVDYKVSQGPIRVLVHLRAKGGNESTIGSKTKSPDQPLAFLVEHRLAIYPDLPWFDTRFVSLTNQSNTKMNLCDSFFYVIPSIKGDSNDDELVLNVPNYYLRNFNFWSDPTGYEYGALALGDTDLKVSFYINPQGGKHPDAMLHFDPPMNLAALQRYHQFDSPPLHIIGYFQENPMTILPQNLFETIKQRYAPQIMFHGKEKRLRKDNNNIIK